MLILQDAHLSPMACVTLAASRPGEGYLPPIVDGQEEKAFWAQHPHAEGPTRIACLRAPEVRRVCV